MYLLPDPASKQARGFGSRWIKVTHRGSILYFEEEDSWKKREVSLAKFKTISTDQIF